MRRDHLAEVVDSVSFCWFIGDAQSWAYLCPHLLERQSEVFSQDKYALVRLHALYAVTALDSESI